MKHLFAGLSLWALLFLLATIGVGFAVTGTNNMLAWHIKTGLFTAVFLVMLHCLVFIHLLGTGLGVKRAVFEHKLPEGEIIRQLWKLKMRAFPPAFSCMVLVIAVSVLGGAVQNNAMAVETHRYLAIFVLLAHLVTIPIEVHVLGDNLTLMQAVDEAINAQLDAAEHNTPPQTNPPQSEQPKSKPTLEATIKSS